jgi:hypothetical protein
MTKSEKLFGLVTKLRELHLNLGLILHVAQVNVTHMIEQEGIHGLSHSAHLRMKGRPLTAHDRQFFTFALGSLKLGAQAKGVDGGGYKGS